MAILLDLPREIVTLICSFLKQAATYNCCFVNKEFNAAAVPELWREPVLSSNSSLNKLIKCVKFSKRGEYIRALRTDDKISLNDDDLLQLLPFIPNLEVFEIRMADELSDKSIIPLARRCQQLITFSATGSSISYRSMHYLGLHCRHVTKLTLAYCRNLTPMALLPFVNKDIEHLDLSGCKWLTDSDTAYDISCLHSLTYLNLVCCDTIDNDFIQHITTAGSTATTIANTSSMGLGSVGNNTALSGVTKLQEFSITGGSIIDDNAMIPFIKAYPHMRDMFLLECAITDATLDTIAVHMPHLEHLDLSFCGRLTINGIRHLINHCFSLKLLGLKGCGLTLHDFPEIPIRAYAPTSAAADDYPQLNTLTYAELTYIREEYENHLQQPENTTTDRTSMMTGPSTESNTVVTAVASAAEDNGEIVVMPEAGGQDEIAAAYRLSQQYLDLAI